MSAIRPMQSIRGGLSAGKVRFIGISRIRRSIAVDQVRRDPGAFGSEIGSDEMPKTFGQPKERLIAVRRG
jgi:hypothetical protein